jgi:hypothetical protein
VENIIWHRDGTLLCSSARYEPVRVWDGIHGNVQLYQFSNAEAVSFHPVLKEILMRTKNGFVIFDIEKEKLLRKVDVELECCDYAPGGNYVVTVVGKEICVWETWNAKKGTTIIPSRIDVSGQGSFPDDFQVRKIWFCRDEISRGMILSRDKIHLIDLSKHL